jgi:hypothetical protein
VDGEAKLIEGLSSTLSLSLVWDGRFVVRQL